MSERRRGIGDVVIVAAFDVADKERAVRETYFFVQKRMQHVRLL